MNLGDRICRFRTMNNMSQGDLANSLDVSRQSISKWETNSSVPELDKLIKLCEVFNISLDELVLGVSADDQSSVGDSKVCHVDTPTTPSLRKKIGILLICFSILLWLMVSILGDVISGFLLAFPFAACGVVCIIVKKYAGLWCGWIVYFYIDIYLCIATGINWQYVFIPFLYSGEWTIHLIAAWCLFGAFFALIIASVICVSKLYPISWKKDLIASAVGWIIYVVSWFVFALPAYEAQNAVSYPQIYRFTSAVSGFVRSAVLTVSLVLSIRVIISTCKSFMNVRRNSVKE